MSYLPSYPLSFNSKQLVVVLEQRGSEMLFRGLHHCFVTSVFLNSNWFVVFFAEFLQTFSR